MGTLTSTEQPLLTTTLTTTTTIPKDTYNFAYFIYFLLGASSLFPWNTFLTAVDYFTYLYPTSSIDRLFTLIYMLVVLLGVSLTAIFSSPKSNIVNRTNVALSLFLVSVGVIPVMDLVYVKGRVGVMNGYYVTVGMVGVAAVADALGQSGIVGSAGELPVRYMQAVVAGASASGVLVSFLRIITKSIFSQDAHGLRKSANVYFTFTIVYMAMCIFLYNLLNHLPIIKYYKQLKTQAANDYRTEKGSQTMSTLWEIIGKVKYFGFGILLIYVVTLSIFPGYVTEDVHSESLKDWYPILLITCYNVFDLVGRCLTSGFLVENMKVVIGGCVGRVLFYPLFLGCLHGPQFFRTEIPVAVLTGLVALTNGYLTSVLFILAPKSVQIHQSETAGIVIVLFLCVGRVVGSVASWFWVI
ncbi:hypothetical protein ACHQM5_008945 [Ranunculus cassubicifolius]